jgi:hypothetical protein
LFSDLLHFRFHSLLLFLLCSQLPQRFHATQPLDAEVAALRAALERARSYRGLVRGFPADALEGAASLPELAAAVRAVFEHLRRARKVGELSYCCCALFETNEFHRLLLQFHLHHFN